MADGNELDDDLDIDSVEYETEVDGVSAFMLPDGGFSTPQQKEWAEKVARELAEMRREVRIQKSQTENANRLANDTNAVVSEIISDYSEEMGDGDLNLDPLAAPSQPVVESRLGTFEIAWDGLDLNGEPMANAFQFLNVYAAKTADLPADPNWDLNEPMDDGEPEVADPDDPIYDIPGDDDPEEPAPPVEPMDITEWPPAPIGVITDTNGLANVVLANLIYNTEYTVWFMAVDKLGNTSPASVRTTASVQPLVDTDVIGRVIDGANIELESLNEELFDARLQGKLDDLEAATSQGSVLIENYSFEFDYGWTGYLFGSTRYPPIRQQILDAPSGSWVLTPEIAPSGTQRSGAVQVVTVIPGNTYRLRWYARNSRLGGGTSSVDTRVSYGDPEEVISSLPLAARDNWTSAIGEVNPWHERTLEFTAQEDSVVISFLLSYNASAAGPSQIDRVVLDNLSIPVEVNGNFFAEVDPSQDGTAVGQLWYKRNTDGDILAMWEWTGSAWNPLELTNAVIANLDAGKITTGFLDADRIQANTIHGNKIISNTILGDRIVGNTITGDKIVGETITGDKIAALTIEAGNLAVNAVEADKIAAGAIDGKLITGATIRTNSAGRRWVLDSSSFRGYDAGDNLRVTLNPDESGLLLNLQDNTTARFGANPDPVIPEDSDSGIYITHGGIATPYYGHAAMYLEKRGSNGGVASGLAFNSRAGAVGSSLSLGVNAYDDGWRRASFFADADEFWMTAPHYRLNAYNSTGTIRSNRTLNLLWNGTPIFMTSSQTINLSENISDQLSGIVLVWSRYSSGSADNIDWNHCFVPKRFVAAQSGGGTAMSLAQGGNTDRNKYVYISNATITGLDRNGQTPNNTLVLRYVYGV